MPARPCRPAALLLVLASACTAATAVAGEVYRWTDSKGVTHYGDRPPAGVAAKPRKPAGTRAAATATAPVANTDCSNARANLKALEAAGPVGLDFDRDGKVDRPMTDAERAGRLAKAKQDIETYCEVALDRR